MMTNVDLDWRVLLDSDWELFGGEIKLNGVDCRFDSVALHADSSEAVDWQDVEDDVLSLCSSAASWSCLHGNSLLETYSEMYEDLCKPEDDGKFDQLLSDELIADIASCMNDDLPVSLEQFHKISCLGASAEIDTSDSHYLLFSPDVTDDEVVGTESCGSDEDDVSKKSDHSDALQSTVSDVDVGTDPYSPDSEVANLEYEELYEESVTVVEAVPSTVSCRELQSLMSNCDKSVIKFEPSDNVETTHLPHLRQPAELRNSRRLRKKEQNKTAALRYRLKKRSEQGLVMTEYSMLERKNIELRTRLDAMTKEISYLKALIDELCP